MAAVASSYTCVPTSDIIASSKGIKADPLLPCSCSSGPRDRLEGLYAALSSSTGGSRSRPRFFRERAPPSQDHMSPPAGSRLPPDKKNKKAKNKKSGSPFSLRARRREEKQWQWRARAARSSKRGARASAGRPPLAPGAPGTLMGQGGERPRLAGAAVPWAEQSRRLQRGRGRTAASIPAHAAQRERGAAGRRPRSRSFGGVTCDVRGLHGPIWVPGSGL
eukprot:scaffold10511_cov129-Isochrysis_galbana.AAC.6